MSLRAEGGDSGAGFPTQESRQKKTPSEQGPLAHTLGSLDALSPGSPFLCRRCALLGPGRTHLMSEAWSGREVCVCSGIKTEVGLTYVQT